LLCLWLCNVASTIQAQETAEGNLGAWHLLSITARVSDHYGFLAAAQVKYYEPYGNFNQTVLRTGINYYVSPHIITSLSYGYQLTDPTFAVDDGAEFKKEHQIGAQITYRHDVGKCVLDYRFWLEQRFVEFDGTTEMLQRTRYRLQINLPLTKRYFMNMHSELFLNLQDDIFGQIRFYGALGLRFSNHLNLHAGYFRSYTKSTHLDRMRIALFYLPDFRKKPNELQSAKNINP
tara:strand:- start:502 stop:1200 length:699 start_codon:yes stop_codon:yes gene_type:complete